MTGKRKVPKKGTVLKVKPKVSGKKVIQKKKQKKGNKRKGRMRRSVLIPVYLFLALLAVGTVISVLTEEVREAKTYQAPEVAVYNHKTGELMQMDLETYIVGVVSAEMPAEFELEALKAQAVACRTYAFLHMGCPSNGVKEMHPDAQLSTSPTNCQAWIGEIVQKQKWGAGYSRWAKKIQKAVSDTRGEILLYNGAPAETFYHASCGGTYTENVKEVWTSSKPYLVRIACNHKTDAYTPNDRFLSWQEFCAKIGVPDTKKNHFLKCLFRSGSGRIQSVQVGDQIFPGIVFQQRLGLNSTLCYWDCTREGVLITTRGLGHGVGMCQYGADFHAKEGADYREILSLYYPNTKLQKRY